MSRILLADAAAVVAVDQYGLMQVTEATARWMRQGVERLGRHCPAATVDQLRPVDVAAWVEAERRGGAARHVTINSYLRAVKVVFSRLERRGLIEVNPARPVPFLKEPPAAPKAIMFVDYRRMRELATRPRDRAILDVLWGSGCRLGGLLSMRVDRLEQWTGAGGWPCFALDVVEKYDRPRRVYLGRESFEGESLAAYLTERPATDAPALFLTYDEPARGLAASTVEGVIRQLRIAAGIPKTRPASAHAFRHAFALRMLNQGEDLSAVSAWLGHHSPEFTAARYAVRSETELRAKFFMRP